MSESMPPVSIPDIATALRSAITGNQELTLSPPALGDPASATRLFDCLGTSSLTLTGAQVTGGDGSVIVSGRASFLTLTALDVALTISVPDGGGIKLALSASPSGGATLGLAEFPWLAIRPSAVTVELVQSPGKQSLTSALTGVVTLDGIDVQVTIGLPRRPQGMLIRGSISSTPRPSPLALAGQLPGFDMLSALPPGLGDLLTVRDFTLLTGAAPYVSFTLVSAQPWTLIPDSLSIESAELTFEMLLPVSDNPLSFGVTIHAVLRVGALSLPIALTRDDGTGEWMLALTAAQVPIPGLTELAGLFGGAQQLESAFPGLGSFGGLTLTDLQLRVDLVRHTVSSLAFQAAAQEEWTLPLFGGVPFGRPILSLAISGMGRAPYLAVRLTSEHSWELISQTLTLDAVTLFVGADLSTTPRKVMTRVEAALGVGDRQLPLVVASDPGTGVWTIGLDSPDFPLPDLVDLAAVFGMKGALEDMLPGLGSVRALLVTELELQVDPAHRTIPSLTLGIASRKTWTLPYLDGFALRQAAVALRIASPLGSRSVTGSFRANIDFGGLTFRIQASKDTPTAAWLFSGSQVVDQPLSLTALASQLLPGGLPDGVPEISFVNVQVSMDTTGAFSLSGSSAVPWTIPLGFTDLVLSNIQLALHRTVSGQTKAVSLQVSGDLAMGGLTASLGFTVPGGFVLSASLPAVRIADVLHSLGCDAVLQAPGPQAALFNMALGPSTITLDVPNKTASISGSISGFGPIELRVYRDSRGKLGVALGLAPQDLSSLPAALKSTGLDSLKLSESVFVFSSLYDPALHFSAPAFAALGAISRGLSFVTRIDLAAAGLGNIAPALVPTSPLLLRGSFGPTLADLTLAIAMSEPGGRFVIDRATGLALIDPELRISPAKGEVGVAGKLDVVLDSQTLEFVGGFVVAPGSAKLTAALSGQWDHPFGISGLTARDLVIELGLPGKISLGGTLQVGRQSGTLFVKIDPQEPVLKLELDNIDLHDLLSSVGDPALSNLPASVRQTLTDVRIDTVQLYVAPRATKMGSVDCPAGILVAGKMHIWGLLVDAKVQMAGSGVMRSLAASGTVSLPNLGGLVELGAGLSSDGKVTGDPSFLLNLAPGLAPQIQIHAVARILGGAASGVEVALSDSGFTFSMFGPLLGGALRGRLDLSGSSFGSQYSVYAEVDGDSISGLLGKARDGLKNFCSDAQREIDRAAAVLKGVQARALQLQQDAANLRQQLQAQRDADLQKLRDAQAQVQRCSAPIEALQRAVDAAYAKVSAERDEVNRRLAAAQRDVDGAHQAVSSLSSEINSTDAWFHGLPKVDFPWKPSQAREGAWFGIKMGGLYVARDAASEGLNIASRTLQAIRDVQNSWIPVELDPRVAGTLAALVSAQASLSVAQAALATLQAGISLAPIDADFRLVAMSSMAQVENLQCVAAQAAFDLAKSTLSGLKDLGNALRADSAFTIQRASFAGELSTFAGGSVRLGLEVTTPQGASSFSVSCDLRHPETCIVELINRLLGGDTGKAIAAAQQSTAAAASTISQVQNQALVDGSYVNITCHSTGKMVRVVGMSPLRYGDRVSFRAPNGQPLTDLGGVVAASSPMFTTTWSSPLVNPDNANFTTGSQWLLTNPDDPSSRAFIRYGDAIALYSQYNHYLTAGADHSVTCRSATIGSEQRWTLLPPSFSNLPGAWQDEVVALSQHGLRGCYGNFLSALDGGGSGVDNHSSQMQAFETFQLVAPDRTAESCCLVSTPVPRSTDTTDAACLFQIKRFGDWFGLLNVKTSMYLSMGADLTVRANVQTASLQDAQLFRLDNGAVLSKASGRYLHFDGSVTNLSHPIDGQGTVRDDDGCLFVLTAAAAPPDQRLFDQTAGTSGTAPSSAPALSIPASVNTASDQSTQSKQQDALSGRAAAADGPSAERLAVTQTSALKAGLDGTVAPAQQALAQADADRRARRERAIEKAARGSSDAISGWHDGALRFDGRSYLEAPATRAALSTSGVQAAPILALGTGFTVEAWICPESLGSEQSSILSKWNGMGEDEVRLFLTQEGRVGLAWRRDSVPRFGAGAASCLSDVPVKLDAWCHVAAVRDGDSVSLYIDGRRAGGAQGLGTSPLRVGACSWRIGGQEGSSTRFFVGLIDSIRIWDQALDQAALCSRRFVVSRGDEAGLLACWNFDEPSGDTAFDAGRLELHARLRGQVHRAVPGAPEGLPLPDRYLTLGGSSHAQLGDVDLFAGSTAFTIEAWVRVTRIAEDIVAILDKWTQSVDDELLFGLATGGKLIFAWHTQGGTAYSTPGWNHVFSAGAVPLGRWCHVAVVRDGRGIRFYLDGVQIGASDSADMLPLRRGTAPLCIGSERGVLRHLEGSLAEVRVLRRAVPADELREHYRRPFVGDEPALAALWRLDEGTGRTVRDATSAGNHAALIGPVTWPALGGPPRVLGPTRALHFTGSQYIEFADADDFSPGIALTIELWICLDTLGGNLQTIIDKWGDSTVAEYMLAVNPDGSLRFGWRTQGPGSYPSPSFNGLSSTAGLAAGRWTHVAVVRAGTSVAFFIDGSPAGAALLADDQPLRNGTAPLRVGLGGVLSDQGLRGSIAGLRIWRAARTAEQLVASMSGLVSSRAPGRILDLRFDEGAGSAILDAASGRLGTAVGAPGFIPVTLPVRQPQVAAADPNDTWWQSALDQARSLKASGVDVATAMPEIDAALAQIQRSSHAQVTALLAKAGYTPQELGAAIVRVWSQDAAEVARQLCQADRPAAEALVAIDAALALGAGTSHPLAANLAGAAGYLPEELGAALWDVWGLDPRGVAKLYLDAGLASSDAARAVWAALGRGSRPCFSALVDAMLASGHAPAAVGQALTSYFGCDASTVAQAVLRSGGTADVAGAAAGDATVIPAAPTLKQFYLFDTKHRLCLAAGDVYDQHVYHQSPQGRANELWTLERAPGGGFLIRDQKHGKCLVAGDTYDGNVYHQDPAGRLNAVWDKVSAGDDACYLVDQKHGKAIAASDVADGSVHHQDPAGRPSARWMLMPVSELGALKEIRLELDVAFVAYLTQQPGTIPIYRETRGATTGTQVHYSSRTAAAAQSAGWTQTNVAFFAFATQLPGTVPVYREESGGLYFFTTRLAAVTTAIGYQRDDIAFYAYPPDALSPRPRVALKTSSGRFVHLTGSGVTGVNLVARRSSVGGAEPFQLIELGQDRVALKASSGRYVTALHDASGTLAAQASSIGAAELFTRRDKSGGLISLKSNDGTYVSELADQSLKTSGSVDQDGQSLTLVPVPVAEAIPDNLANVAQTFAWTPIPGASTQIAAALDGAVWCVNSADQIYRWSGGAWQQVSGLLRQLSVGSATQVWGVNATSATFRWNGSGWDQVPGSMSSVSVAFDGTVWGLDTGSRIARWNGSTWQLVDGALRQLSVGSASQVWGVNANSDVFRWSGSGWDQVPGSLKNVSVSADGTVMGVTPGGALCIWRGGGSWEVVAKGFQQVAAASSSQAWAVGPSGAIYLGKQAAKPVVSAAPLVEIQEEVSIFGSSLYKYSSEPADVAKVAGWTQRGVAFVACSAAQPGTVPIYKETPVSSPGSQFHFWHRTAAEAQQAGWLQQEVAFHAFTWQAPGTVPVYRECVAGTSLYHFSTRSAAEAAQEGFQQLDIAFYAYRPGAATPRRHYVFDSKNRRCLAAGDVYDQHVYHQTPQGRTNSSWTLEPTLGGGFLIRDEKHGKCLVAGDVYDGKVYHQDPAGRPNALWDKVEVGDGSFYLVDQKHGKAIATADDPADTQVYHQDPAGRPAARWNLVPVSDMASALLSSSSGFLYFVTPAGDLQLSHHTPDGRFDCIGARVGGAWGTARRIMSAGDGHVYILSTDGALSYCHHNLSGIIDVPARSISAGWSDFIWVGVGRFGRIYGVTTGGDLLLYEHDAGFSWTTSGRRLGTGWGAFLRLFAGGSGVLYAVRTSGELLYYQHDDAGGWPKQAVSLGLGWDNFASLQSGGSGNIYGVKRSGDLCLYQHDANLSWLPGSGRKIASGWAVFDPYIPLPSLAAGSAAIGPAAGPRSTSLTPSLPQGPLILATAQGAALSDTFALSTAAVSAGGFQANCLRVDTGASAASWTQQLKLGWLAMAPLSRPHMQCMSVRVGTGSGQLVTIQGTFAQAFASPPRVLLTAHGQGYGDTFVVSTNGVTATGFSARLMRTDYVGGWGQDLSVDCLAFDSLLDFAGIEAQGGTAAVGVQAVAGLHVKTVTVTFAQPFSQPPIVLLTPRGEAYPDVFAATATAVTSQGFQINVVRMDGALSWGQNLQVDWLAVVPPAPGTVRTVASSLIVPVR